MKKFVTADIHASDNEAQMIKDMEAHEVHNSAWSPVKQLLIILLTMSVMVVTMIFFVPIVSG